MKRLLSLAFAVSVVMSLAACRRSKPVPPSAPPPASTSPEVTAATGPAAPVDVQKLPDAPKTMEVDLSAVTTALRTYVADRQINPKLVTDLNVLVPKYLPHLPPLPAGKKFVWDQYLVVSFAKK